MKKIITLIAAAAMLAVSCQKEAPATGNTDNTGSSTPAGKLTATFVQTKVTYTENGNDLQPAWQVGDKIIGFDDAGNTYTLTVASVEAETATLSGTVPDGALHLIYKSGAQASDISSKTLAVDYTNQAGDKTMPAVMLADGTVADGSCEFTFTNAGAIIGISALKGVPSGAAISKITVEGENLSAATVTLDGTALKLTATPATGDAISTATLSGITTTDDNGTLSSPIFIAVPAGAKIAKVTVPVTKEPETMTIPSTAAGKKGIDYVEIAAKYDGTNVTTKKWAKWNVGANNQSDYGWYFAWAGTEGYVRYENTWQLHDATSIEFSYSLSSAKTTVASDYLYVKTQSFKAKGFSFSIVNTPYQTQNTNIASQSKYTKYLGSTSSSYKDPSATDADALKTVLDPEDDAAHIYWGDTWRMPTSAEFQALYDATYWAWDETDKGFYVFSTDASHSAGTWVSSIPGDLSKTNALLFFPAAGCAAKDDFIGDNYIGYNSSSLDPSKPNNAYRLYRYDATFKPQCSLGRSLGMPVRPLSD